MPRKAAFATAHIENFIPRSNQFGDAPEFGPGNAGNAQRSMKVSAPIKVHVEGLVSGQHRIEEGEPARGLPQAEVVDPAELPVRRDSKSSTPQSTDQPSADRLNEARCR